MSPILRRCGGLLAGVLAGVAVAGGAFGDNAQRIQDAFVRLHWRPAVDIPLPLSKSRIDALPRFEIVVGDEAQTLRRLVQPDARTVTEAEAFNPVTGSELVFQWEPTGFVGDAGWDRLDPGEVMRNVRANEQAATASGHPPAIRTAGWRQAPRFDRATQTVSWIGDGVDRAGNHQFDAIALKLGRYGVERIGWIPGSGQMAAGADDLTPAMRAFRFETGARWEDRVAGVDRAAAFGLGALVVASLRAGDWMPVQPGGHGLVVQYISAALAIAVMVWGKYRWRRPSGG